MTKRELLENEAFKNAPMNALIEVPNNDYEEGVDDREDVTPTEVRYWGFKNLISIW